ncbi:ABC transporter permease [Chthonomonas calidirosea]|uniref:ABC transporter permease n=1 Tax=Chthonomonas calidirosea TaxID=454171 RepID=UPI0006ECBECB|nr:ABC transporter permease [Chthonomonas calidirosea]CEK14482.1 nucleoside ABC transporter membrane protein [Chthonomonas calidirosea]
MVPTVISRPGLLRSLISVAAALLLAALLLGLSGYNVAMAFGTLWSGATGIIAGPAHGSQQVPLGSFHLDLFQLAQTLTQFIPLLLCGLAVAVGLQAGLFNIGGQGQFIAGAVTAAAVGVAWPTLPSFFHLPLALLAGTLAGAVWGGLAGLLKAWRQVNEVVSTIMLNYVADNIANYLITHSLKDPHNQAPQTAAVSPSATLPILVRHTNLSIGLFLALLAVPVLGLLVQRTALGFRIRAVGRNAKAARVAGVPVKHTIVITMALSGALAGLAGTIQVLGAQHRYFPNLAGTYGFDGIAVALLAGIDSTSVFYSALFFGALAGGAGYLQDQTNIPDSLGRIIQAIIILFVGMRFLFYQRKRKQMLTHSETMPVQDSTAL